MNSLKNRVGLTSISEAGQKMIITEYFGCKNITIQFEDNVILKNKRLDLFIEGRVLNPMLPTVTNIGFLGIGKYSCKDNPLSYQCWSSMLKRCYGDNSGRCYENCTVHKDWHNFQNFAKWFEENFKPEFMQKWHLDKDLLVRENKIYSSETCCFAPAQLNSLLIGQNLKKLDKGIRRNNSKFEALVGRDGESIYLGIFNTIEEARIVYITEKEKEIKRVANKFKDLISNKLYRILMDYKIEK